MGTNNNNDNLRVSPQTWLKRNWHADNMGVWGFSVMKEPLDFIISLINTTFLDLSLEEVSEYQRSQLWWNLGGRGSFQGRLLLHNFDVQHPFVESKEYLLSSRCGRH